MRESQYILLTEATIFEMLTIMKANTKVKQSNHINILLVVFVISLIVVVFALLNKKQLDTSSVNPADFSTTITNPYFSLPIGIKLVYEAQTDEGLEKIEIEITGETKTVMGVNTLVYRDKEWLNNILAEDTRDYLAQHKNGDIWYFGEDVDNYNKIGVLVNHSGSWWAGVNGARPGIWIKANPIVGESYQQEYYPGEAEDMVTVLSLNERVDTKLGTFTNCLKTRDWTPLDPASLENKYYCPRVKTLVLEEDIASKEKAELVNIIRD